ncbi:MAG: hypothetical protein JXR63_02440 [Spirochaetales bacterium]|nr:hypothetical protein [Spirochaetales bacterium]
MRKAIITLFCIFFVLCCTDLKPVDYNRSTVFERPVSGYPLVVDDDKYKQIADSEFYGKNGKECIDEISEEDLSFLDDIYSFIEDSKNGEIRDLRRFFSNTITSTVSIPGVEIKFEYAFKVLDNKFDYLDSPLSGVDSLFILDNLFAKGDVGVFLSCSFDDNIDYILFHLTSDSEFVIRNVVVAAYLKDGKNIKQWMDLFSSAIDDQRIEEAYFIFDICYRMIKFPYHYLKRDILLENYRLMNSYASKIKEVDFYKEITSDMDLLSFMNLMYGNYEIFDDFELSLVVYSDVLFSNSLGLQVYLKCNENNFDEIVEELHFKITGGKKFVVFDYIDYVFLEENTDTSDFNFGSSVLIDSNSVVRMISKEIKKNDNKN